MDSPKVLARAPGRVDATAELVWMVGGGGVRGRAGPRFVMLVRDACLAFKEKYK